MECKRCGKSLPGGSLIAFDKDSCIICPECFDKELGDTTMGPKYIEAFEKGRAYECDYEKKELIKTIKNIVRELHELNKNLKRR